MLLLSCLLYSNSFGILLSSIRFNYNLKLFFSYGKVIRVAVDFGLQLINYCSFSFNFNRFNRLVPINEVLGLVGFWIIITSGLTCASRLTILMFSLKIRTISWFFSMPLPLVSKGNNLLVWLRFISKVADALVILLRSLWFSCIIWQFCCVLFSL